VIKRLAIFTKNFPMLCKWLLVRQKIDYLGSDKKPERRSFYDGWSNQGITLDI